MKIAVCVGTRPEIIKMAPVIRACIKNNIDFIIVDSGQHYSKNMSEVFFEELKLPKPKHNLEVGSGTHAKTTAKIIQKAERVFIKEKPDIVLVQGDTNTALGFALTASKLDIKIGHVEAGLRSRDMSMPEEKNRIIIDHISDFLFAPTFEAEDNLISENITENVFVIGNTIVDATLENINYAKGGGEKDYILVTAHRQENVDNKEKLGKILNALAELSKNYKIIYPIHPRTRKRIEEFGLEVKGNVSLIEPVGYTEFLGLEKNARVIITDSGGVQEEACILGVPCVTIRDNTERPETIEAGANILAGTETESIIEKTITMIGKESGWSNPFGQGRSGEKIVEILTEKNRQQSY